MSGLTTSVSDTTRYNLFCERAATDDNFFKMFRRQPEYMEVVETLEPPAGMEYISIALRNCPHYLAKMDEFRRNDTVGTPPLVDFPAIGVCAPTTLRYIKVASDIERFFGTLRGMHVAEIGVGYGGQCRILSCLNHIASYSLFDLPSASKLARRYLDCFAISNVIVGDISNLQTQSYDLVISNYALSEIRKDIQDIYISRVLQHSSRGYLIYNQKAFAAHLPGFSYSAEELAAQIPHAEILRGEYLLSKDDARYGTCLIVWGRNRADISGGR
jgi:hypothetical protein